VTARTGTVLACHRIIVIASWLVRLGAKMWRNFWEFCLALAGCVLVSSGLQKF
jgi:hypothetical protein